MRPLGITCAYAEHRPVLTLAGRRSLHFGGDEHTSVARELLALIALIALTEQDARGYALRSRCDLVGDGAAPMEVVKADGATDPLTVDRGELRERYDDAYERAERAGFCFRPLRLTPQPKLVEIVRRSGELALQGDDDA